MIESLPLPDVDEPYAKHLELMRLVMSLNTGAVKSSVCPIIDASKDTVDGKVKLFGVSIADAIRCYAVAAAQQHGMPERQVIRSVVTAMRCELSAPTGGGISVEVDDDLALRRLDVLEETAKADSYADPRCDDMADGPLRRRQDDHWPGGGDPAE